MTYAHMNGVIEALTTRHGNDIEILDPCKHKSDRNVPASFSKLRETVEEQTSPSDDHHIEGQDFNRIKTHNRFKIEAFKSAQWVFDGPSEIPITSHNLLEGAIGMD